MLEKLKKDLDELNTKGADWVGLRRVNTTQSERSARDGKPESNSSTHSQGTMIEVLKDGFLAYAACPSTDPSALQSTLETALQLAQDGNRYNVATFSTDQRPPSKGGRYQSQVKRSHSEQSAAETNELLVKITEKLKTSEHVIKAAATQLNLETDTAYVSSNGAAWEQKTTVTGTDFNLTTQKGNVTQVRSDEGYFSRSLQAGLEAWDVGTPLWDRVKQVAEEAHLLLEAEDCPTGSMDLILMPDQMMLQIHESVGHPLELDRILGDERNYAGWSFVKPDDFGTLQYGSEWMNIVFDPTVTQEIASFAFDDLGYEAKREFLIREGKLERGLGGLESQARLDLPGVATSRAQDWNRAPIDRMSNLNLLPGKTSLDHMISSVENGVLMKTCRSWSIDDYRRKFQFGCEWGQEIKNGKLGKPLKNANYRGRSVPFWKNLAMLGDASTFKVLGTPHCGKGEPNQVIRVGHASPAARFTDIEVFGGA